MSGDAIETTLGDFGAGGHSSRYTDQELNRAAAAKAAASGEWEYLAHTDSRVAWHIPGENADLQIVHNATGWELRRAGRQVSRRRDSLADAIEYAEAYMADNPDGGRTNPVPLGSDQQ